MQDDASEIVQKVLETAGFEADVLESMKIDAKRTVFVVSTEINSAMDNAKKILAVSQKTGYVPLFIEDEDYDGYMECLIDNHKIAKDENITQADQLLAKAEKIDVNAWVEQTLDEGLEIGDFSKSKNTWSTVPTSDKIVLVPVKHSWQIPAVIYIGGWNECPEAEIHIALHKLWHEKYGSEFISMGVASVYNIVTRPVKTREEALILAKQQAAYCIDNVVQGNGDETISGLAIDLMDSSAWQFWWD